jgi:microcystin-dependent protein
MLFLTQSSNLFFEADEHLFMVHNGNLDYVQNSNELQQQISRGIGESNYLKLRFTSNMIETNVSINAVDKNSNIGSFEKAWKTVYLSSNGIHIENQTFNYTSSVQSFNIDTDIYVQSNVYISGNSLIPIGTIFPYAGITILPEDYLWCNGASYSRTLYSKLFQVIGTTYGGGDGISTFNVPNLKVRTPIGAGLGQGLTNRTLGSSLGQSIIVLTNNELPPHTHNITITPTINAPLCLVKRSLTGNTTPTTYKNSLLTDPSYGDLSGVAPDVTAVPYGFTSITNFRGSSTSIPLTHSYCVIQYIIKYQ